MLSIPRAATGLERHLCASEITPFSQAKIGCLPKAPLGCHMKRESSDMKECTGDCFGCLGPGWPAGGFSETSGSIRLSLVTQPTRSFIDQCNSRLTKVSFAVNNAGLVVSMPDAECLRGMRHIFLGLL